MSGIYIHIPFCHAKCAYCDFYSLPKRQEMEFIEALKNEYGCRKEEISAPVKTVYLGGGTPSCLKRESLHQIFNMVPTSEAEEITIEINPEDAKEDFILWLKNSTPVNRISMGVQSLDNWELEFIGRRHSAEDAVRAVGLIKSVGFNLSVDLIYGLPYQDTDSWKKSLTGILALKPDHLSCYLLSYEPGTRLTAMKSVGKVVEADEELATEMYDVLCAEAAGAGYLHYEISNFALPGFHSRHNSSYWNLTPYLGLGPGAHSFDGRIRRFNPGNLKEYIGHRGIGVALVDEERESERFNDFVITSLRTAAGLDMDLCEKLFGRSYRLIIEKEAARHIAVKDMWRRGNIVGINPRCWLKSDAIMVDFIQV